jgi:predicted CDP-diglyceride synthetase/phosphatidate cytidylyltransferase
VGLSCHDGENHESVSFRHHRLGTEGKCVTGASGLLDRVDAQCFATPVFFILQVGNFFYKSAASPMNICVISS